MLNSYKFKIDFWSIGLFYAIDRKNWIATTLGIGFTVCHLIFALVNFIL